MKPTRRKGSHLSRYEKISNRLWSVRCDCGKELSLTSYEFRNTYSCGCLKKPPREPTKKVEEVDIDLTEFDRIALVLGTTRQRAHDLFKEGLHRYKKNWILWETVFETNLDEHPERAAAVVASCRALTKVLNRAEKQRKELDAATKVS
jgi:hypothetical protein